jgi:hypothetical protein
MFANEPGPFGPDAVCIFVALSEDGPDLADGLALRLRAPLDSGPPLRGASACLFSHGLLAMALRGLAVGMISQIGYPFWYRDDVHADDDRALA